MALREWLFNGTPGDAAAKATVLAEDGTTQPTSLGINTGVATIKFSSLYAQSGTSLEIDCSAGASAIVRLPNAESSKTRVYRIYHRAPAPGTAVVFGSVRHASGQLFRIGLSPTGQVQIYTSTGALLGSSPGTLTYGAINRFEFSFTIDTSTTGSITSQVFAGESTTPTVDFTLTGVDLGTADCSHFELGTPHNTTNAWIQNFDSFATNSGTTMIGPRVSATPLATPVVSISKVEPTVYGGTGSFTATWPAVSGAGSYKVSTPPLPGNVTTGTPTTTTITALTYTWTAQPDGTQTVTVQAIPA